MASVTSRMGLIFAALAGAGAASLVGSLLRALPAAPAIAAENPFILVAAPIPIGALVAVAHIYWLRRVLAAQRPPRAPEVTAAPAPADVPLRSMVPPPEGDEDPPRWRPVIRN